MGSFMEMWEQMGHLAKVVVLILAIMSVWSISVMIERYITYRKARKQSQSFAPAVAEALGKGNLEEAVEICRTARPEPPGQGRPCRIAGISRPQGSGCHSRVRRSKRPVARFSGPRRSGSRPQTGSWRFGDDRSDGTLRGSVRNDGRCYQRFRRHECWREHGSGGCRRRNFRSTRYDRSRFVRRGSRCLDVQLFHRQDRVLHRGDGQFRLRAD